MGRGGNEKEENEERQREAMHRMREAVPGEVYRKCSQNLKSEEGRYPTSGQIVAAAVLQSNEWNKGNGSEDAQFTSGWLEAGTSGEWTGTAVPLRLGPREDRYARTLTMAAIATGIGTMIMAVVQVMELVCR